MYDGLEHLQEDEEEDEEEPDEGPGPLLERPLHGEAGDGIFQLQRLWERYRDDGEEPELGERAIADLHALLARDAPKCPSIATVAWMVRTLEQLAIEEDDILELLADILIERSGELEPQSLIDAASGYGNVFWVGDDLLDALATAARRQLADFTQAEVVVLFNGLTRMGGTDDSKYVGLYFEMSQRVNLPDADKFIRETMSCDAYYASRKHRALPSLESMPNRTLRAKAERLMQWKRETGQDIGFPGQQPL